MFIFYDKDNMEQTNYEENNVKEKAKRLSLTPVEGKEGLFTGLKSDGKQYTVRSDRHRYFFPVEWIKFMNEIPENRKILFETLLQTGGRIDEVLHLKPKDFIWDDKTVRLRVTKVKAKKGESKLLGGKQRSFGVSSQYIRKMKKFVLSNKIAEDSLIFTVTKQGVSQMLKRALQRAGLKEWEFSLHNIRKTTGMWFKTVQRRGYDLDSDEICMRLGHDHNTFLQHYGSPSIFTEVHRDKIIDILGDVYNLR